MRRPLPFALLAACAHAPPAAPPTAGVIVYDVAVLAATGERRVTGLYALELTHAGSRTWTVRTLETAGTVEEAGGTWTFDSAAPTPGDPWPLVLQHAVAAVPAAVRFDPGGAPEALVDPDAWTESAREALDALDLPEQARPAGLQLLDPEGLVADLRRSFPGTPPEGAWERAESVSGVAAVRAETCAESEEALVRTWTCSGPVTGPDEGPFHLHDGTSTATLVADTRGLLSYESAWSATLLWQDGEEVRDVPVGGRRLVRRR